MQYLALIGLEDVTGWSFSLSLAKNDPPTERKSSSPCQDYPPWNNFIFRVQYLAFLSWFSSKQVNWGRISGVSTHGQFLICGNKIPKSLPPAACSEKAAVPQRCCSHPTDYTAQRFGILRAFLCTRLTCFYFALSEQKQIFSDTTIKGWWFGPRPHTTVWSLQSKPMFVNFYILHCYNILCYLNISHLMIRNCRLN